MKHPFDVHVGLKLCHCRRMAGLSRQQLGEKLGADAAQIEKLETGECRIDAGLMRKTLTIFEVPAAFLFEGLADALSDAV